MTYDGTAVRLPPSRASPAGMPELIQCGTMRAADFRRAEIMLEYSSHLKWVFVGPESRGFDAISFDVPREDGQSPDRRPVIGQIETLSLETH
jgi:hypothetical protein